MNAPSFPVDPLHVLYLPVQSRALAAFAHAQRLGGRRESAEPDPGYVLHALLAALFGDLAPRPFTVQRADCAATLPLLPLLAYTCRPVPDLMARAMDASELARDCIAWSQVSAKPMPTRFPRGQRLGFSVTVCPVRRLGRGADLRAPGSEVDAYLLALDAAGRTAESPRPCLGDPRPEVDRATVYQDWLREQMEQNGTVRVLQTRVCAVRRTLLFRRGLATPEMSERPVHRIARPVAEMAGTLEVADPEGFAKLIARGVGRHRAFGFGMLLLHPPERRC
ncbi:Type I-E CRISPR-associated protein Cas6/Cse3/CasE [Rhodovastum atsumiense]|uniref:Type I-E CRISPR-associated protein Cas6/Cse3/CasE n=1 Tax=Rhodovastum atsumiense TaxID=504468 RepID=A0A5M6INK0_9PROT|nr:type I-E CRISPR-associated protein Cas6/Cse3/CasE [Rhodovastum atsumiense]KAA5609831.1 type I-E CRISPR-associated protein Cas6/Cse3/CasE [Rhodovastum atsumiense]CAH2603744.1 Type I-E CRISPR-associated protein Cas6/Cse3/CasE [Rhodovastum atsumiense]